MTIPDGLPPLTSRRGDGPDLPEVDHVEPEPCPAHNPTQHRDRRPAWCDLCGRDAAGNPPAKPDPEPPAPLPPVGARVAHVRRPYEQGVIVPRHHLTPERSVRVRWDSDHPDDSTGDVPVERIVVIPAVE